MAQPCTHLCVPDIRITEIVASAEWGDFVGLWLSRMVTSKGVGGLKNDNDTIRTKLFVLTDDQLSSFTIANEKKKSDQNCDHSLCCGSWLVNRCFLSGQQSFHGL